MSLFHQVSHGQKKIKKNFWECEPLPRAARRASLTAFSVLGLFWHDIRSLFHYIRPHHFHVPLVEQVTHEQKNAILISEPLKAIFHCHKNKTNKIKIKIKIMSSAWLIPRETFHCQHKINLLTKMSKNVFFQNIIHEKKWGKVVSWSLTHLKPRTLNPEP